MHPKIGRNQLFSIMKGIAIISVVIGHSRASEFVESFVNQYHLATFFFVAGYLFRDSYLYDVKGFIKKRIYSLYFPFVIACLSFLLLHNILAWIHVYDYTLDNNEIVQGFLDVCVRLTSSEPLMGAMWFCPVLLWVSLLSVLCLKVGEILKNRWSGKVHCISSNLIGLSLIILMAVVASAALHILHLKSPYCIWQNMIICLVFLLGRVFRIYFEERLEGFDRWQWVLLSVGCGFFIWWCTINGLFARLQASSINQENTHYIFLIAFAGCMMVYGFAKVVNKTVLGNVIAVLGEYSFSIMLLHFLAFKVIDLLQCLVYAYPVEKIAEFPTIEYNNCLWFFAYVIVGSIFPVFLSLAYGLIRKRFVFNYG